MSESEKPNRLEPSPFAQEVAQRKAKRESEKAKRSLSTVGAILAGLAVLLSKFKGLVTVLLSGLKFLKLGQLALIFGKLLTTSSTMLLSVVFYAQMWGWRFALGFVVSILLHELGHVFVAWRLGMPVSAPIFIPGMGALILQKKAAKSAWEEALIGIGGPIGGTIAGILFLLAGWGMQSPLLIAVAYTGFLINLFNMIPIMPMDGGWIVGAVSPRLWAIGLAGLVVLFFTGTVRNPLLLFLILLSLPRLWQGIRSGRAGLPYAIGVTPTQRLVMGLSYLGLSALLGMLMVLSHHLPA